jgi:hypothetical protein
MGFNCEIRSYIKVRSSRSKWNITDCDFRRLRLLLEPKLEDGPKSENILLQEHIPVAFEDMELEMNAVNAVFERSRV